jgi:class 3 adenylate cyclase
VGDTVNLAARIEDHTKAAGRPILIDQSTSEGLPKGITLELLGPVVFRGKQQPVQVFAVSR